MILIACHQLKSISYRPPINGKVVLLLLEPEIWKAAQICRHSALCAKRQCITCKKLIIFSTPLPQKQRTIVVTENSWLPGASQSNIVLSCNYHTPSHLSMCHTNDRVQLKHATIRVIRPLNKSKKCRDKSSSKCMQSNLHHMICEA